MDMSNQIDIYYRDQLNEFGIVLLTGEACNYSQRILCDLTAKGCKLVAEFYGLPQKINFKDNWNSGPKQDPHIGSCFVLPSSILDLLAFCMLRSNKYVSVVITKTGNYGCKTQKVFQQIKNDKKLYGVIRYVVPLHAHPHTEAGNTHTMSGRTQ